MAVFAVIAATNADKLQAAVTAQYGANHYQFSPSSWFVPDTGTSKDVADKLGLTGGTVGALGVVVRMAGYSGWANGAAWSFLSTHPEAISNG